MTSGGGLLWGYGFHGGAVAAMGRAMSSTACALVGDAGRDGGLCVAVLVVSVVVTDCHCFHSA